MMLQEWEVSKANYNLAGLVLQDILEFFTFFHVYNVITPNIHVESVRVVASSQRKRQNCISLVDKAELNRGLLQ